MDSLDQGYAHGLFGRVEPPCVSLYQPTHRHHPDNVQDQIRFRNLVKSLGESLRQEYAKQDVDQLLQPFVSMGRDPDFWNHTLDGLGILAAPGFFRVYRLQRSVPELVVAAGSFHLKPLRRILQSADRYQILALTREKIRLFEGNRDVVDEIEPAEGVPRTLVDALGAEVTDPHLTVSSYGGAQGPAMHDGHGSRKEEIDVDSERFFRAVDRALLEHHSKPSGLALLLVGLADNQSMFRRVSRNPFLIDDGIDIGPESVTEEMLRERAWQIMEPRYIARLEGLIEKFNESSGKGLATDDLEQAAAAAHAGRVATLLVDADCRIPGRIEPDTGRVVRERLENPEMDDVLDDLGELVVGNGGEWIIVPRERMPTRTGLAAICRY